MTDFHKPSFQTKSELSQVNYTHFSITKNLKLLKVSLTSESIKKDIPSHFITFENNSTTYSFLSFRSKKKPIKAVSKYLEYNSQKTQQLFGTEAGAIEKVSLKNSKFLEVELSGFQIPYLYLERVLSASVVLVDLSDNYRVTKELTEGPGNVSLMSNQIYLAAASYQQEEMLLINCIETELRIRKRLVRREGKTLRFSELCLASSFFRRVEIEISVKLDVIKIEFSLNLDRLTEDRPREDLKKYLRAVNKKIFSGQFYLSKKLVFQCKFHSFFDVKTNMSIFHIVQRELEILYLHLPNISEIILKNDLDLEEILNKGRSARVALKFKRKYFKCTEEDLVRTKEIKKTLDSKQGLFFANRFNQRQMIIDPSNQTISCVAPYTFATQEELVKENPTLVIHSIYELIEELSNLNLYFKDCCFPSKQFVWFEEKPVFNYDVLLSDILDHRPSVDALQEPVKKTQESVLIEIINFHSQKIKENIAIYTKEHLKIFPEDAELVELNIENAIERIKISQSNFSSQLVKPLGICEIDRKYFIILPRSNGTDFRLGLNEVTSFELIKRLEEVLAIIEEISIKNSQFVCFDLDCIKVKDCRVFIEVKALEELDEVFKAPEVLNGRSHRSSILFSFGKLVQFIYNEYLRDELEERFAEKFQRVIAGCSERIVLRRIKIQEIKDSLKDCRIHLQI